MSPRAYREYVKRGPPFVEVDSVWYLNVAFELPSKGSPARSGNSSDQLVLRRLTDDEAALLKERRLDVDLEVWAKITA